MKTSLILLTAIRSTCKDGIYKGYAETTFFKDNKKYATIPAGHKQPRFNSKRIILNCWEWELNWLKS
jgi:hypothetical protein